MDAKVNRKHTLYVKDVLPAKTTRHIKNAPDINTMVQEQLSAVKSLEEKSKAERNNIIAMLGNVTEVQNYSNCTVFGYDFLQELLAEVESDEMALRNKILGKQETVEMFKTAVNSNEVDGSYLEASRMDRDKLSESLFVIVNNREKLFSALEVFRRVALPPTQAETDHKIISIKENYISLQTALKEEHKKLKMYTDWQKNPELMYKQTKAKKERNKEK